MIVAWLAVVGGVLAMLGGGWLLAATIRADNGVEIGICVPLGGLLAIGLCTLGPLLGARLASLWRRSARLVGGPSELVAYRPPHPIAAFEPWLLRLMQDTRSILREMDHLAAGAEWWPTDGWVDGWLARLRRRVIGSPGRSLADFAEVNRVTRDVWEWLRAVETLPTPRRAVLDAHGIDVAQLRNTLLADGDFHARFVAMVGLIRRFEDQLFGAPIDPFRGVGATHRAESPTASVRRPVATDDAEGHATEGDAQRRTYRTLIRRRRAMLRAIAAKFARTPADREDLEQDILLAIWKALPEFRGESSLSTYARRIAYSTAVDFARRRRVVLGELEVADPGPDPEEAMATARVGARLYDAIDELPRALREVLLLHLGGYAYRAIAERTGTTAGNVGARLTRARARLRRRLDPMVLTGL